MRGAVTGKITEKAKELLNLDNISTRELRLMPYIQYTMMNNQTIDPNKISKEERGILADWRSRGFILGGASGLAISKDFWDAINEILWLGYVAPE